MVSGVTGAENRAFCSKMSTVEKAHAVVLLVLCLIEMLTGLMEMQWGCMTSNKLP